jgi:hypothetical protein
MALCYLVSSIDRLSSFRPQFRNLSDRASASRDKREPNIPEGRMAQKDGERDQLPHVRESRLGAFLPASVL